MFRSWLTFVLLAAASSCGLIPGGDALPTDTTNRAGGLRIAAETDHLSLVPDASNDQSYVQQFSVQDAGDLVRKSIYFKPDQDGRFVLNNQVAGEAYQCEGDAKLNGLDFDFKSWDATAADYTKDPKAAGDPKNPWYDFAIHANVELRVTFIIHNIAKCKGMRYLYLPSFVTSYPMPSDY
ncbi:MAG: hypothetical protein ACXWP5_02675 [Bdellovibrionota bacterium]